MMHGQKNIKLVFDSVLIQPIIKYYFNSVSTCHTSVTDRYQRYSYHRRTKISSQERGSGDPFKVV